jgi:hypothetical protein
MGVIPGLKGRPRRHTDGIIGVGGGEPRAPRGQGVQIRRLDQGMSGTSQHVAIMLIGHDDKNILLLHGKFLKFILKKGDFLWW